MEKTTLLYRLGLFILLSLFLLLTVKLFPLYKLILLFIGKLILPFVLSGFISYLLYPIVLKLTSYRLNRISAIVIIYALFFGGIGCAVYYGFPLFVKQVEELSEQLPGIMLKYEEIMYGMYESTAFLPEIVHDKLDDLIIKLEGKLENSLAALLMHLTKGVDVIIILTIIPVLVFYFLKDFDVIKQTIVKKLPNKIARNIHIVLGAIDVSLGRYIRGQFLICLVIIFLTLIVYDLLQLKYALLLAVFMGIMNIIPYFGPLLGTTPAVLIAMTMSWKIVVIVLVVTVCIQVLEGSLLSPYIMGKSVELHPILIILILFIGAELGGIIGMVLGIPLATIIRSIIRQFSYEKANRIDI